MKYVRLLCMVSFGFLSVSVNAEVSFEKEVLPIIQDRCLKCHQYPYIDKKSGKVKKPKEDLLMESAASLMKGSEHGAVIVPGKPEESSFYKLIALDEDDDDIMPPKGEPLTQTQIARIKQWIAEGAEFGGWIGKTEAPPLQ